MKTPEEIKSLAETAFQDELIKSNQNINWIGYGKGIDGTSKEKWIELWIKGYNQSQQNSAEIISFFEEIWEQMNGRTDEKGDLVYIPQTLRQKIRNYKSLNK